MTDGRDLEPVVAAWLRQTLPPASESTRLLETVSSTVPTVRQQRYPWPLLPVSRSRVGVPGMAATTELRTHPIPATNGQSPTVIGRTQSMFSPAKAIAAGVIVFAIGGVMLIAQPFGQQGTSGPGAASAPAEPVTFTASLRPGNDVGSTTFTEADGRRERRGTVWAPSLTASDPRLEGEARLASPEDQYPGQLMFRTETWRIENDEGAWQGTTVMFDDPDGRGNTVVLAGEGAYEGLYAALDVSDTREMRGVIFPAPPPAALDPAPAP